MPGKDRRIVRKPATKFGKLQKKLGKQRGRRSQEVRKQARQDGRGVRQGPTRPGSI